MRGAPNQRHTLSSDRVTPRKLSSTKTTLRKENPAQPRRLFAARSAAKARHRSPTTDRTLSVRPWLSSKHSPIQLSLAMGTIVAGAAVATVLTLWSAPAAARQPVNAVRRVVAARTAAEADRAGYQGPELDSVSAQVMEASQRSSTMVAGLQTARVRMDAERLARARAAKLRAAKRAARARAAAAAARRAAARRAQQARQAQQAALQPSGTPQQIAMSMLASFGWSSSQFSCLDSLWQRESGWSVTATNPSSGAYGIPQAYPASQMASAGPNYLTNPATQIRWGLGYIRSSYGSPCGAWAHESAYGWY